MGNTTGKDKGVVDEGGVTVLDVRKDVKGITTASTKTDEMGNAHRLLSSVEDEEEDDDDLFDEEVQNAMAKKHDGVVEKKKDVGVKGNTSADTKEDTNVNVTFKWTGKGTKVGVSGSFNNWTDEISLQLQTDGSFSVSLTVPPGKYEYKYLVDGEWKVDANAPVVTNQLNSLNNLLDVQGTKNVIPYTNDSVTFECDDNGDSNSGRASPEGEYGQQVPDVWNSKPPRLPPHLLKVTLNAEPENNDPTQLPIPNHVMLNHLYALSIKDNVIVLGSSSRYKKKFVTTVVYKPMDR
eukprot:m.61058 g.61058  ORF g.61058 m.61058 type:complete len:293 (+) comp11375_c1_seq1:44-922(+)